MTPKIVDTLACSFCGKKAAEVERLIAGPAVFICNECVELCSDIIAEAQLIQRLQKDGKQIISRAGAERLAWMKTWTTAAPFHSRTGG